MLASAYPNPSSPAVTAAMRGNRKRDTKPEVRLRSALHRAGLRFRKDQSVSVAGRRPVRVDIVFPKHRLAIFVDGCFWHSCPVHGTQPRTNPHYWGPKLTRNVARDREVDAALRGAGWRVVRVWEHEPADDATAAIASLLGAASPDLRRLKGVGLGERPPGR